MKKLLFFIVKSFLSVILGISFGMFLLEITILRETDNIPFFLSLLFFYPLQVLLIKFFIDIIIYFIKRIFKLSFLISFIFLSLILLIMFLPITLYTSKDIYPGEINLVLILTLFFGIPAKTIDYYLLKNKINVLVDT
jgi:hypothetical protein